MLNCQIAQKLSTVAVKPLNLSVSVGTKSKEMQQQSVKKETGPSLTFTVKVSSFKLSLSNIVCIGAFTFLYILSKPNPSCG